MDDVEERVASLEGRALEQSMRIDDVREAVSRLEVRIGSFEEKFDRRFERLENALDQRFAAIDQRFTAIDQRFTSISSQLFGLIVGVAVAAISGLLGMITAVFR